MFGRSENQGGRFQHLRKRARIVLRVGRYLRERDVAGFVDEFPELPIGYRRTVDPEAANGNAVSRRLFRVCLSEPMREVPPATKTRSVIVSRPTERRL